MPIAVFALALAAFAIGTTEFIISGILLSVSHDLSVGVPVAGLLVTTEAMVAELPKEPAPAMPAGGGMGGGMGF